MGDESGESMELMEEVPLKGRIGEISACLTERSRELIPETTGSILEQTICFRREDDVDGHLLKKTTKLLTCFIFSAQTVIEYSENIVYCLLAWFSAWLRFESYRVSALDGMYTIVAR